MLVIAQNLLGLVRAEAVCAQTLVEEFSLRILLDRRVRRMRDVPRGGRPITYGTAYEIDDFFHAEEVIERDVLLMPGGRMLACSADRYHMPDRYFGLVQTKGSLARLFVSTTCNDGQVEPGYDGKITLEIMNDSRYPVTLPIGSNVAQLFVFRCTTIAEKPYNGRYQGATGPTIATFELPD